MRKMGKRLIAGIAGLSMAFGLFPTVFASPIKAEAAAQYVGETRTHLPGDGDWFSEMGFYELIVGAEDNEWFGAQVTSVTVPKAYKDYVWVVAGDDGDGDGTPDGFQIETRFDRDDETQTMVHNGAQNQKDAVGKTIPLTVGFDNHEGLTGKATVYWEIKDSIWECNSYDNHGANHEVLPDMTTDITFSATHRTATWRDDESFWDTREETPDDLTWEFSVNPEEAQKISYSSNKNVLTVSAPALEPDSDPNEIYGDNIVYVKAYEGGAQVIEDDRCIRVSESFDGFFPIRLRDEIPSDLQVFESRMVRPQVLTYSLEHPEGVANPDASFEWTYDENTLSIVEVEEGSYLVTRMSPNESFIQLKARFKDAVGEDRELWTEANVDRFDGDASDITTDNSVFMLFDEDTSKTFTLDTTYLDKAYAEGCYSIEWKAGKGDTRVSFATVFGNDGTGFTKTSAADGITISDDGKSITFDGSKLVPKYYVEKDAEGNRYIDGADAHDFLFLEAVVRDPNGNEFGMPLNVGIRVCLSEYQYDDVEQSDRWEKIMPGDVLYLDQYYYYVKNPEYPVGRYFPVTLENIKITGYKEYNPETGEFSGEKNATVALDTTGARPALKTVEIVSDPSEDYNAFGFSKVEYTYKDYDGRTQNGSFIVDVSGQRLEVTLDNVTMQDAQFGRLNRDSYGNYDYLAFNDNTLEADVKVTRRAYDFATGKMNVEDVTKDLVELSMVADDRENIVSSFKDGHLTITGKNDGGCRTEIHAVLERYEDGEFSENLQVFSSFWDNMRYYDGLDGDKLEVGKPFKWDGSYSFKFYDDDGVVSTQKEDWHAFGFSYDPAELSVTVNGEELGSKFSKGPFVITKKVDKKVRFKLARVDYNEWNNTSRYTSDYEDFVTAGTSVAKVLPEVDKSTVKLTKTSLVYNGKAQTVQVSDIKDKDGNVIDPKYYDVTGNKKTKAGNYIAKVSFKEPYTGEVSLKWSITPKKLTVSGLKFKDKFYDGSKYMVLASQTPKVSGVISGDKVTVKTTRADYVITGTKSAGSKKRKLTVGSFVLSGADAANYKLSAGVTVTGTIKKVTVSKVTLTKNEVSYTGAAQKPVIKVITGNDGKKILAKNCTIKYLRDGKETTDFTSRGTITVSVTGATNWKGTASATYTIR